MKLKSLVFEILKPGFIFTLLDFSKKKENSINGLHLFVIWTKYENRPGYLVIFFLLMIFFFLLTGAF
jgi:hypothetical protein